MNFELSRVDIWTGEVKDRRGALADMLKAVLDAGADLDFIIGRPSPVKPNTGILYLAPLSGPQQVEAAQKAGLVRSVHIDALRVTGPDRPGIAEAIARTLADVGLNLSGISAARTGNRFVMYLRFESEAAVADAEAVLRQILI